jgi:tetratricopeptide (TPR) repeat protein
MSCFKPLLFLFALVALQTGIGQTTQGTDVIRSIEAALNAHDFNHALQLTQVQLQHSPKNVTLWTFKGIALARLNRNKDALSAYNTALRIAPDHLAALEGAAELEYNAGSNRALPLLNRIAKLRPEDPTSHAMLGVLAYKQRDCASAVKHFQASRQLIDSQPVALAQFGSCLMDLQQPENAIDIFQQIQKLQPEDPHARYNLAVAQLSAHRAKDAIATLQPLLQTDPPDPDVLDLASSAYEETGDTPQAVTLLHEAIVRDPKKSRYYVDFAAISFNHESFQVGVDMISAGLKQLPNAASLYVARGILHIQLGQFEKGEADFTTATQLDPGQTSSAVAEGLALIQQSNLDQALTTVRSQLKSHPKDAFLQYMQAQILSQQGADPETSQFKEAVTSAVLSTQLKPDFVLARDLLGNLYLKSGEIDKSIEQSRRALQASPSDQEALYHLIQALRHSGQDRKGELPALVKRLAVLRQESRNTEAAGARYRLYESQSSDREDRRPK